MDRGIPGTDFQGSPVPLWRGIPQQVDRIGVAPEWGKDCVECRSRFSG